ncbi:uncharacterized protein LOC134839929 [Symsagittifera roscoffensis]|uniref:uncharacterized protein LOC134839929 n=1 Tax=Symsagittifera roscoffensis TaxID=84072 RepID=UPI00307BA2B9
MKAEDYRGFVGSLLYIAKQTWPDILATVTQLSPFMENPGRAHWVAAKRGHRYLKESKDLELCYTKKAGGVKLCGFADADWAGDLDDRRSTTGYRFYLRRQGQQLVGAPKSNQLQPYLPVRLSTNNGSSASRGSISAITSE